MELLINFLRPKRLFLSAIFLITFILVFFFGGGFWPKKPLASVPNNVLGVQQQAQGFPRRLQIPSINIDSEIEYMGINTKGEMEVPSTPLNVGWYKFGPLPGEKGSAVISGHLDGLKGKSGVFKDLGKLKPDDKIYILNGLGVITTFAVRESRTYDPGFADEVFFSNDDKVHLNLVTCDGVWDPVKKSYAKRLVVFTDSI